MGLNADWVDCCVARDCKSGMSMYVCALAFGQVRGQ